MNIDDFLESDKFKPLSEYLENEMIRSAGDDLVAKMIGVFGNTNNARNWFYTNLPLLGGKRPYDYCNEDKVYEIEIILGRIEHGVFV